MTNKLLSMNDNTTNKTDLSNIKEPFLVFDGINKSFYSTTKQQIKAIDNLNITIKKGELLTLLGPSGCGKTTALRILAGFEQPDTGNIFLEGQNITLMPANKRNMPLIFQSYALFPHLTVFENIAYGLKIKKKASAKIINNDVEMMLHIVNLVGLENRYPRELSGGQQQRTALARALILKPPIILFDEPLSNLDIKLRIQTRLEIKHIQRTLGITSIYVTHDQEEALSIADRIVVMNEGKTIQVGTPKEIYNKPNDIFVADFIGNANFIEAIIIKFTENEVILSLYNHQIKLTHKKEKYRKFKTNEEVYITIKPEAVLLNQKSSLKGKITKISFLGNHIQYEIELGNSFITATRPNILTEHYSLKEGDITAITFPEKSIHILKK